jgi:hypothetical protein
MIFQEFIDAIEASYHGEFSPYDLKDLEKFINNNNLSEIGIENLYNTVRIKYNRSHQIPTFGQIVQIYNENNSIIKYFPSGHEGLHPESPLQQLWRAKDWPIEMIIKNCQNIRLKQSRHETLAGWEISFIVIWERLLDVIPDFRDEARRRIVQNGNRELSSAANLNDLLIPVIAIKHIPAEERREETTHIEDVIEDIL